MYRKRNKLIPEDWTEEIEKWEKYYLSNPYQIQQKRTWYEHEMKEKERKERWEPIRMMREMEREKAEKELLQDFFGNYCGHKKKVEMDGYLWCRDCGTQTGRCYGSSVGYNNRHHTMRGKGRKK